VTDGFRRSLWLTAQLVRLLDVFKARGIPVIPLKGPVLAAFAYGGIELREYFDLDLLVRRSDVAKAGEALIAEGYRPQFELAETQWPAFLRYACEWGFSRDATLVELQWQFVPRYFSFPIDYGQLWERAVTVSFEKRSVLSLSAEDLLLYLCVHGTKHAWSDPKWARDVAEVIRISPNLNWDFVAGQARSLGGERMLRLGLRLARDLAGARFPLEIDDPVVQRLAAEVHSAESGMTAREEALFHLRSRERLRDRARYCFRLLTTHTILDWQVAPFPRWLFFLYYFTRPFRLINKYWRKH